jgi:hypothetical protein
LAIELSHIGEPLVGRMLAALAERGELDRVTCAVSGVSLTADLGASPEFIVDRAVLRVHSGDQVFACDGAQTVDILAAAGDSATAMELKLGVTRMAPGAFQERFCGPCGISGHTDLRLTGSMVAVLDRLLPFAVGHVSAVDGHRTWRLADHWWLVIRQRVWLSWAHRAPVRSARVLVFDQLARLYGGPAEFDQLVRDVVANDFAYRWEIDFDQ